MYSGDFFCSPFFANNNVNLAGRCIVGSWVFACQLLEELFSTALRCLGTTSLVPRHQIFRARPAALSKNRVWTPSLVKLGCNYTSVVSCCRTNQIAPVK